MKAILLAHARKYPLMEPTDAIKLLYQSEFGGGHLIRDEEDCLKYLHQEYASVHQNPSAALAEDIGNGMVRIYLAALDAQGISPRELGNAFIRSASLHKGSMDSFHNKLLLLKELTLEGKMPFSPKALEAYLAEYEKAGCPAVSHSDSYRRAYQPAYRIIDLCCLPNWILKPMP